MGFINPGSIQRGKVIPPFVFFLGSPDLSAEGVGFLILNQPTNIRWNPIVRAIGSDHVEFHQVSVF